ncbi:MAG: SDR family NAD(P)-dependent oxidoreductase [Bacteroidales bacterium]|nr:SDR family NAD(P)-dependent oxidoreductase [Bacteroidales bacterium]
MNKTALITGATSGIGKATAIMLAKLNYNIIITGRREERLNKLSEELKTQFNTKVRSLNFDIRNREETKKQIENLPSEWQNIDILVNNAGLASGLDFIHEGDIDDWEKMIDTNVKGLLYISRAIMPGMVERKYGHIVNISSIAGKETYFKGNVYCATKHAVDSITKAMRIDMLPHGIRVTSISPGMVDTEFSEVRLGSKQAASTVYDGLTPLYAQDIADAVEFAVTRPKHVTINDMLIMPTDQANSSHTHRI